MTSSLSALISPGPWRRLLIAASAWLGCATAAQAQAPITPDAFSRAVVEATATRPARGFTAETLRLVARAERGGLRARAIDRRLGEIPGYMENQYAGAPSRRAQIWPFFAAVERLAYLTRDGHEPPARLRAQLHAALLPDDDRPSDRLVVWAGERGSGGGVLNQRFLWAVGGYVLGRFFDEPEEVAFAERWLRQMADAYAHELTWESDSAIYDNVYLRGWVLLLATPSSPEIEAMARAVLDRMMISLAAKYVDGLFCGVTTRDKVPVSQPAFRPFVHGSLGPLFGGTVLPDPQRFQGAVRLAVTDYTPPEVASALAHNDGTVTSREYFANYPYAPLVRAMPPHWRNRWTFKRPTHVLGAMGYPAAEIEAALSNAYRQQFHPLHWKLCWNEDGRVGQLFVTHPSAEVRALPQRPELWASPSEWAVQHRNVVASLYVLPPHGTQRVEGVVPFRDADELAEEGPWLALRVGRLLVALYVHHGFELVPDGAAYFDRTFDTLVSHGERHAVVVAAYTSDDLAPGAAPSVAFERLRTMLRDEVRIDFEPDATPPRLRVRMPAHVADGAPLGSVELDLGWRDYRRVDGRELDWLSGRAHYAATTADAAWGLHVEGWTEALEGTPPFAR